MGFLIAEEAIYQSDDQAEENMDMEEEYAVQEGEESDTQYEQEEQQVKYLFNGWQLAKNEKEYSWHVPVMKFIGMKQLV